MNGKFLTNVARAVLVAMVLGGMVLAADTYAHLSAAPSKEENLNKRLDRIENKLDRLLTRGKVSK